MELLRYLSPTAMIPIAVIWFGIGEMSKYFLIFWGTFFIVLVNTTAGVWRAPITRQRAAECLGANRLQIFVMVVVPSAVPYIVTGMRVAMASSFMSIIPAEIIAAVADQSNLRGPAHDLHPRLRRGSHVPLPRQPGADPLHVLHRDDVNRVL
jgi:ABC-type nitrate/sulfonate/bicarbonate transport system permease component